MSVHFPAPPPPPSNLGRYRQLSPHAGVHVSPLLLGGGSIGNAQDPKTGTVDKESSFRLLDAFFDKGGNFIDTGSNYQDETSEKIIGEWVEKRGIRDQLFIATKYSVGYKNYDKSIQQKVFFAGNSVKSMHVSIHASLEKLRTSYVDLFYLHWYDYVTSIEEIMRGLHTLVLQGKVLYLGISDAPAWIVSKANQYARDHALTPFSIYQGAWNVMERSFERDIIPMARSEGLAIAPWNVLAAGKFRTDAEAEIRRKQSGGVWKQNEVEINMSHALEKVANEVGAKHITAVAIAYLMHKTPYVFPIIGGRKVEDLLANLEALEISLSPSQMAYLESIVPLDLGFPGNLIGNGDKYCVIMESSGNMDKLPAQATIPARPK